jgi:hypothetical protein
VKEEPELGHVAQAILAYLSRHPDANDTAEGIRQFWFTEGPRPTEREVSDALQELTARGLVNESKSPAAKRFYGVNRDTGKPPDKG